MCHQPESHALWSPSIGPASCPLAAELSRIKSQNQRPSELAITSAIREKSMVAIPRQCAVVRVSVARLKGITKANQRPLQSQADKVTAPSAHPALRGESRLQARQKKPAAMMHMEKASGEVS